MLGPNHYKKKIEKNAKKARKQQENESPKNKGGGSGGGSATAAQKHQQRHSTVKGPIVSHDSVVFSNDAYNTDPRTGLLYGASQQSSGGGNALPRGAVRQHNTPGGNQARDAPSKRKNNKSTAHDDDDDDDAMNPFHQPQQSQGSAGLASSKAQKKLFAKSTGDELLNQFKSKLSGGAFRLLNEQIYNSPCVFAEQLLRHSETFEDYHAGYRTQLAMWPLDPNKLMIDSLLEDRRGRFLYNKAKSMPGHMPPSWVVADMGCGDARVARALAPKGYKVHSFDLGISNENKDFVTVASSAHVPLPDSSCDIVLFSLSLMGTDYMSCLFETYRVLKPKRLLKIIEVRSRIPDAYKFAEQVEKIGFSCDWRDVVGNYFVAFDFIRNEAGPAEYDAAPVYAPNDVLLPSMYKKR